MSEEKYKIENPSPKYIRLYTRFDIDSIFAICDGWRTISNMITAMDGIVEVNKINRYELGIHIGFLFDYEKDIKNKIINILETFIKNDYCSFEFKNNIEFFKFIETFR